ncbi:hypothetical protein PBV87_08250 [Niameybacter massiliensis]|uniref:Uncharacterized protein n=1 Tax=Holtiella tumoricola TaxID=3018743 RepID=A0AA42DLS8_9FIRM|nr:hypothetical protein [Holtiella tumoricola]MDA3731467.1 hypothetical protein [Holtiella tumoricola]
MTIQLPIQSQLLTPNPYSLPVLSLKQVCNLVATYNSVRHIPAITLM